MPDAQRISTEPVMQDEMLGTETGINWMFYLYYKLMFQYEDLLSWPASFETP